MSWAVELSAAAEKELKRLPRDRQAKVERAIDSMEEDPFTGDVRPLKGPEWKGRRGRLSNHLYRGSQGERGGDFGHSHSL